MYENLQNGIGQYLALYQKGLKKQANQFLHSFISRFESAVPQEERDAVLYKLCRDICDENKYPELQQRGNSSLPFELSRIVWTYLNKQCELENMPQMRWAFQLYGKSYNPFDPQCKVNLYQILKKAYQHKECDTKTVQLYFHTLVDWLYWGSHHFPDICLMDKNAYQETVKTAEAVMSEKEVDADLIRSFQYYCKLYNCFYEYETSGRKKDFYKLCRRAGIYQA